MTEKEFNLPEAIEDIRERGMKIKLKDAPKEFNLSELKELLTNLTVNQNSMAKKIVDLSNAIIEIQEILKNGKRT